MINHVWLIPVGPGHDPTETIWSIEREDRIILVDDGADLPPSMDPRIKIVRTEGSGTGCAHALNVGYRAMVGDFRCDWIYRMDADDKSFPMHGRTEAIEFIKNQNNDIAVIAGEMIDQNGVIWKIKADDYGDIRSHFARRRNPIYHPATCIRYAALAHVGGWPENYGQAEDFALWIKIGQIRPVHQVWTDHFSCSNPVTFLERMDMLNKAADDAGI